MTHPASSDNHAIVVRNAVFLVAAQIAVMPVSIATNALIGRYLGPVEFGFLYLASNFANLGFIFVDWGQQGTLPAAVARDRSRSGELLGSALAWRAVTSPAVYALLAVACWVLGYPPLVQTALALVALNMAIAGFTSACLEIVRGFERTDIAAYARVLQQLLTLVLVVPVLALGGRLAAALWVSLAASVLVGFGVAHTLGRVGVGPLRATAGTARALVAEGWPFLLFSITTVVQPYVDAVFLSKLAPTEVVGWHAAAQKLVGALVFPAAALIGAMYPTLCRLASDPKAFQATARRSFETAAVMVVPLALACGLYADVGIRIFGRAAYGPAADNVRVLAVFVLLVYVNMALGSTLLAVGRQRKWAMVQLGSIVVSLVLDPVLVPFFQRRAGNGGLGICFATLASESLIVAAGLVLIPRAIFDRTLGRTISCALASGLAMAVTARLLADVTPFLSAPLAFLAYLGCLKVTGALDAQQIAAFRAVFRRDGGH